MIWVVVAIVVVFLLIGLPIANYSGSQLLETYEKYSKIPCYAKLTGGQFALKVSNEITGGRIAVARTAGYLTDAYSSRAKTVVLSDETCDSASVASLAVVAHEFGHAMQHLSNFSKFKFNLRLAKITRILGYFIMPIILVGLFLVFVIPSLTFVGFIFIGVSAIILFISILFKLLLIPVEKDASKRGLKILTDMQIVDDEEYKIAKDLLNAALLTYVGDFFRALLWWTFLSKKTKLF